MAQTGESLPPMLETVLIRLGKAARLNVTQAVKLPYLVDVIATHLLGAPITEGTHETWAYGVVTSEVWHYLDKQEHSPILHLEPVPLHEDKRVVIDVERSAAELTPEQGRIVDFVAEELAVRAVDLGRITKFMNPEISSWGSANRRANLGPDAFERLSDDYQRMAETAASVTLDYLRRNSTRVDNIEDAVA